MLLNVTKIRQTINCHLISEVRLGLQMHIQVYTISIYVVFSAITTMLYYKASN